MKIDYSDYVRLFLLILISVAFIFGGTKLGMFVYQSVFSTEEIFPAGTSIGPVSVAGLSPTKAQDKLSKVILKSENKSQMLLTYGDQKVKIPSGTIEFLITESIAGAEKGVQNPLIAKVSADKIHPLLLQLMSKDILSAVNFEDLDKKIATQAALLQSKETSISLTPFFKPGSKLNRRVLADANIRCPDQSDLTDPLTFIILPNSSFSFLKEVSVKYPAWSDDKLTQVASSLYQASLQTNLEIVERQISTELPPGIQAGFEAKVKRKKIDFILSNPNDFPMKFTFHVNGMGKLHVVITGYPLNRRYEIRLVNQKTYPFRKIVQYSSFVSSGSEIVKQAGSSGSSVTVYRNIYSDNGGKIKAEIISDDFYLPVNQIVLRPPVASTTGTTAASTTTTGVTGNTTSQNSTIGTTTGTANNTINQSAVTSNRSKNNNQTNASATVTGTNAGTK